jgi:hypothetical protein
MRLRRLNLDLGSMAITGLSIVVLLFTPTRQQAWEEGGPYEEDAWSLIRTFGRPRGTTRKEDAGSGVLRLL